MSPKQPINNDGVSNPFKEKKEEKAFQLKKAADLSDGDLHQFTIPMHEIYPSVKGFFHQSDGPTI